jgi:DNA repair ATPase RecN
LSFITAGQWWLKAIFVGVETVPQFAYDTPVTDPPTYPMANILSWLRNTQQPSKDNIEDDWSVIDETEREEDMASSICTIEPAIPVPKLDKTEKSENDLKLAVENRILELTSLKKKYSTAPRQTSEIVKTLAQLKDKELKLRKLQKLQKRS